MHDWTGCGVLQPDFLLRMDVLLHGKCRQRGFMKPTQNQFLFAGVGVDVTNREYAGYVCLELLRIHVDIALVEVQSPFGNRTEVGRESPEHEDFIRFDMVMLLKLVICVLTVELIDNSLD